MNKKYLFALRALIITISVYLLIQMLSCIYNPKSGNFPDGDTYIYPIPDQVYQEGETVSFLITASDSNNKAVSLSNSYLNTGMTIEKLSDNVWQFAWDTDNTDAGIYTIKFTANGSGRSEAVFAHFTVNDVDTGIPATRFFESSFETETGKSPNARLDGGKWDSFNTGGLEYIEVFSELDTANGTIYPVDGNNMLSIGTDGTEWENVKKEGFIRPDDEHTYLRYYMCVLPPTDPELSAMHHGIQDYNCEDHVGTGTDNVWTYHFNFTGDTWQTGVGFRNMGG